MARSSSLLYSPKEMFELACSIVSELSDENANSFAAGLPCVDQLLSNKLSSSLLPVVECINSIGTISESTSELVAAIKDNYKSQAWRQPYTEKEVGTPFFNGSAWFPIADVNGPIVYTEGLMEIMLLNANVNYPKHSHGPEELYVVLAGQVWWEAEGAAGSPAWKKAGEFIHHLPHQVHSISAGDDAVLILNVWRSGSFEMPSIR